MYIILRLFCEDFNRMAVEISVLRGPKHGVYAAASSSAIVTSGCSRNVTQIVTSVILYMDIIISHSDCLAVTLKFYIIPMYLQAIRNFLNQKAFSS